MIGRLFLATLTALALAACVKPGDRTETPVETAGTDSTEADTPGSGAGESTDHSGPPQAQPAGEPEQTVRDCHATSGLLAVTGAGGEVTLVHPDGAVERELRGPTGPGHPGLQPTWAPTCLEGRHPIAWTEVRDDGTFVIAVADAGTGEVRRHPSPVAPFYYYWSPDASLLAFLGQNAFAPLQMGVLDAPREEVEMVGEGQPFYFDWRWDSRAMITHVGDDLSMLTLRDGAWSGQEVPLTPGRFQAPAWASPDRILVVSPYSEGAVEVGRRSAAAQGDLPGQRLIMSDPDGTSTRILAELDGPATFQPDPAGGRVAFADLTGPLRVLDIEGGASVTVSGARVAAFQWSPAGDRLLFIEVDSEARALAPKVWNGSDTLVFPSFFPTQVFLLQYLPFWDQYSRSLTLWAPGGDAFTYPAASPEGDRIMVQYLDERRPAGVAEGVFASWSPSSP